MARCWWWPDVTQVLLIVLLVLGCTCLSHAARASRVVLLPLPEVSHCREMVSIGRELHVRGHQVILYVPDYFKVRRCTEPAPLDYEDLEVRTFTTNPALAEKINGRLENLAEEVARGDSGVSVRDVMNLVCRSYVDSKRDLDKFRREKVDMMLIDGYEEAHCLALLPAYLGVPFGVVSSFISPTDCGMPVPTTYYPAPTSDLPGNLGFIGRVRNFFNYAIMDYGDSLFGTPFHQGDVLGKRMYFVDYNNLIKKASLYLENSDYVVDYPKATFPNFLQVGGLTAAPARPLPGPLKKFFDTAEEKGVVVVSFGPHLFTPSKSMEEKLLNAFRRVDARVLLRLNVGTAGKYRNIQIASWFPQNDALGHPNTRLLVSHCGKNSFFEALYHAVPVLCVPFQSFTLGTAARVSEFGVGKSLDLQTSSSEVITHTINTLLKDKVFAKRMNAASALFHSRSQTPAERAAEAVEHVIEYGGSYMRPRSIELGFLQNTGLDVALVVFLLLTTLVVVSIAAYNYIPAYIRASKEAPADATQAGGLNKVAGLVLVALVVLFYMFC